MSTHDADHHNLRNEVTRLTNMLKEKELEIAALKATQVNANRAAPAGDDDKAAESDSAFPAGRPPAVDITGVRSEPLPGDVATEDFTTAADMLQPAKTPQDHGGKHGDHGKHKHK